MAFDEVRCPYHVLDVPFDSTADEIRRAFKRLALLLHPDKLVNSGVDLDGSRAIIKELVRAYEILSDENSRAAYDNGDYSVGRYFEDVYTGYQGSGYKDHVTGEIFPVYPYFVDPDFYNFPLDCAFTGYGHTGMGFYKVYADVFNKIYETELDFVDKNWLYCDPKQKVPEPPGIGNLDTPYDQVMEFYDYWLRFRTIVEFEDRDKKRIRIYEESVRRLARMVKDKDKRVIDHIEKKLREKQKTRQLREKQMEKKEKEMEKKEKEIKQWMEKMETSDREREMSTKKEEELRQFRKRMVDKKMERLRRKMEEVKRTGDEEEVVGRDENDEDERSSGLLCILCEMTFKSKKQYKNHKMSNVHRMRVTGRWGILSFGEDDDAEVKDGVGELGQKFVRKMANKKWRSMSSEFVPS